jgi:hypothetical protein
MYMLFRMTLTRRDDILGNYSMSMIVHPVLSNEHRCWKSLSDLDREKLG